MKNDEQDVRDASNLLDYCHRYIARGVVRAGNVTHSESEWRMGRDSNPRYPFGVHTLSRRARSTTPAPIRLKKRTNWWRAGRVILHQVLR